MPGLRLGPFFRVPYVVTSNFNDPRDYDDDGVYDELHEGQDFDIINGVFNSLEPVLCGFDGRVIRSVDSAGAYGKFVVVQSVWQGTTFNVWYCHMDARFVQVGEQVVMGQPVGELGATGGPWYEHIHINVQVPGLGVYDYVVDDVVDPDPYTTTEPAATGRGLLGLHATADPVMAANELDAFVSADIELVKVMSNLDPNDVSQLKSAFPTEPFIIRAFLDFGGREISPEQFFNDTINDMTRTFDILNDGRELYIEIHNEPNLVQEGLGTSWANGIEFNVWFMNVLGKYRSEFPGTKVLFPGLSPGGTVPGVRQAHTMFVEQARPGVEAADGLGVHVYWAENYPMSLALDVLDDYINRFSSTPIWITEASNNKQATEGEKAAQYIAFANALKSRPTVHGVTYFIASSQNPIWGWGESGSGEIWVDTNIPTIVGQR